MCENNNNNITAVALPSPSKTDVIKESSIVSKTSKFFSVVQLSTVVTMETLQNECKDRNFFLSKTIYDKLSNFSKVAPTTRKNSEEDAKDTHSVSQVDIDRDLANTGISSFRTFNLKTFLERNSQTAKCNSILNNNTSIYRCCYNSRQQIGCDNFFLTTLINMVDIQQAMIDPKEVTVTTADSAVKQRAGISFFIELNEPYRRYSLDENSASHSDCNSSSGDSLCSMECCNDGTSLCDEDFIVFEEQMFDEEEDFYVAASDCAQMDSRKCLKESSEELRCSIDSNNFLQSERCCDLVSRKCDETCIAKTTDIKQKNVSNEKPRKVRFQTDVNLVVIHHMKYWDFAYREARKGPWELAAADRCRFARRIKDLDLVISPCLQRKLESKVVNY